MSLKDIEKLREKVEKDPNSKLFVPLAEEYRKEGMLDEAISVLLGGIERQPGYMSARVSLGKIYLDKGMQNEAKTEFENVVKAIPDNLYAQKKLAEIYRDAGERNMAIRSYRTLLKLNALDEEALASLRDLEEAGAEEVSEVGSLQLHSFKEAEGISAEEAVGEALEAAPAPLETFAAAAEPEEDLQAFKDSLFGVPVPEAVQSEETHVVEEEAIEIAEEEAEEPGEDISFADINEALQGSREAGAAVVIGGLQAAESAEEKISFAEDLAEADEAVSAGKAAGQQEPSPEEAEKRIAAGDFSGAINVYRAALAARPGDKHILQRMEELKALLKLLGKDQETLILRLNAFLEGVRKRHDEFLRSS